jgi:type I restriction enzyme S subunit
MTCTNAPLKRFVDPYRPITYGIVQAGPDTPGGVPYIRPVDMTESAGVYDADSLMRTTHEIAQTYQRAAVRAGDLVISIGPSFGKIMIVPPELAGANLTQGTARVSPAPHVLSQYLYWALQSMSALDYWKSAVGGATFRALNLEPLSCTPIHVPPLEEQGRIADFLDSETGKLDSMAVIRQRQATLLSERVDMLRDSIFVDRSSAKMTRLMYLTQPYRPIVYGIVQAGPEVPDGVPYIKTGDLPDLDVHRLSKTSRTIHEQYRRASVFPGDIVMAMRASIGTVAIVPPDLFEANLTQGTARIAPAPNTDGKWLLETLKTTIVRQECMKMAVGTTFQTLNIWDLRRICVPAVTTSKQRAIVDEFETAAGPHRNLAALLLAQKNLLAERRRALITAAVTGQLDVTTARGVDLS